MGYTPRSTVYVLDFSGTEHEGLEVRMRATALGTLFDATELVGVAARIDAAGANEIPDADDVNRMVDQYRDLADHLVSWNVEIPAGTPLPATIDSLKRLELPLVNEIAQAWRAAMGQVSVPFVAKLEQWAATGSVIGPDGVDTGKPVELEHAELICGLLERFSGYTLQTLMAEDSALLRLVKIEALGRRPDENPEGGGHHGWQ